MPSNIVTRFPGGIGTVAENHSFADLPFPDVTGWHTYFNDFDTYTAGDWVVTETQAGATQALASGDGGILLLTNSAADNDQVTIAKTPAAFTFTAGKRTAFRARFKVSDVVESDVIVGLVVVDTALPSAGRTDGVYFYKDDGSAALNFTCRLNATTGAANATSIHTMVSDTYLTVEFFYDGIDKAYYGVNGTMLGSVSATSSFLPDAITTVTFGLQAGEAVAKTASIDYLFASQER